MIVIFALCNVKITGCAEEDTRGVCNSPVRSLLLWCGDRADYLTPVAGKTRIQPLSQRVAGVAQNSDRPQAGDHLSQHSIALRVSKQLRHRYSGPEILRLIHPSSYFSLQRWAQGLSGGHGNRSSPESNSRRRQLSFAPAGHRPSLTCNPLCHSVHQIEAYRIDPGGRFSTSMCLSGNWIFFFFLQNDFLLTIQRVEDSLIYYN